MRVAQVDYQAAEAAISIKGVYLFHSSLMLPFADQSEHPLRMSAKWERATIFSLQSAEQSSNSWCYINIWVVLQHVSENSQPTPIKLMLLRIRFSCKRKKNLSKPTQQTKLKRNKANHHNRNSCTTLHCFFLLILFAMYFCTTMMTRTHHHKITISLMWARFGQHSENMSWAFIE